MPVYVSLLRGINVGGNKVILMADLKKLFERSGFSNVKTYIQSGNVVFASQKKSASDLADAIKGAIKNEFKFDVEVLVLEFGELKRMIAKNPFAGDKLKKGERIYLTILSEKPTKEKMAGLHKMDHATDGFEMIDRMVYVLCRKGYTKSPFNNNAIEKALKLNATTRNLETMQKLVEMWKNLEKDL